MDRRWGGLLVIFVVVVAAFVVPSAGGRQIRGVALAAPIPGPPAVGDCLAVSETDAWLQGAHPSYRPQALAPCAAARFGEVAAVIVDRRTHIPAVPRIQTPADGSVVTDDPNQTACFEASARYLGLQVGADHNAVIASDWSPLSNLSTAPSGPTPLQQRAGQKWVACVVFIHGRDGPSVSYPSSLRDTFAKGTEPAALAVCLDSPNLGLARSTECDRSHTVEAFGAMTTARPGLSQAGLDRTCRALVTRLTGMTDPSAGGRLKVIAATIHGEIGTPSVGLGTSDDESGYAACLVVSPDAHPLLHTLLALGAKPVPWAS